jgi:hypothetical protein
VVLVAVVVVVAAAAVVVVAVVVATAAAAVVVVVVVASGTFVNTNFMINSILCPLNPVLVRAIFINVYFLATLYSILIVNSIHHT